MFSLEEPINKVIDKLKDDKNYYGDYGKQYLSNSNIRSLINSPNEFKKPTKPAKELIMGSYFHTAMLEPDKLSEYKIKIPRVVFKKIDEEVKINLSYVYEEKN